MLKVPKPALYKPTLFKYHPGEKPALSCSTLDKQKHRIFDQSLELKTAGVDQAKNFSGVRTNTTAVSKQGARCRTLRLFGSFPAFIL